MGATAIQLGDFEALAREGLPPEVWAYLAGGAGDETTMHANGEAWQRLHLVPRVLRNLTTAHTQIELLGRRWAHPIGIAPVAAHALFHPEAECGTVLAAAAQGAACVLSSQGSTPWAELSALVRDDPGRGPLWAQAYWQGSLARTLALVEHAAQARMEAVVLTVDAPVHGARDRERRAGFVLPAALSKANAVPGSHPPLPAFEHPPLCGGLLAHAPTWGAVGELIRESPLPVVLKGLLHPEDARRAHDLGAAAGWVSNHGGRTLDTAWPTAHALPAVRAAVGPDWPLLVDGGIRRGTDVVKALALGANAVFIGRPAVMALAAQGARGVAHALRLLRDEFEIALALCGASHPGELHTDWVRQT
ncbi:alpha-hydroxy acid oxidase [Inhella gelatinilytica]|uniref:Alpha-hydroxy-acid oxidizing protein n=1 Tax=Inhella gelatinilytica TaxID=2795030 RepID=A0A931IV19_9BURK|nr:alpha-hydroxy acid oxidase [Inhella gelatinilytica]MBH9551519.1 alpha-hydroxy-acid oxidizing protein [Inhella gelatinilytica]